MAEGLAFLVPRLVKPEGFFDKAPFAASLYCNWPPCKSFADCLFGRECAGDLLFCYILGASLCFLQKLSLLPLVYITYYYL